MKPSLNGPRLKIRRARNEIDRLRRDEEVFRNEADYQVVQAELNPKSGKYRYRVQIVRDPPLEEWGVWIGEIVHNLRSALDILVYELARLNCAPAEVRDTQFPVFLYRYTRNIGDRSVMGFEGHKNSRPANGSGRKMITRLHADHQARIERLQPYRRKGAKVAFGRPLTGRRNLLYRLSELNNADKHRLLQVVGAKPGAGPAVSGMGDEIEKEFEWAHPKIIEDGTLVVEASPDVLVDSYILPLIAFAEGCEAVRSLGVCYTLTLVAGHVEEIVESFAADFPSM